MAKCKEDGAFLKGIEALSDDMLDNVSGGTLLDDYMLQYYNSIQADPSSKPEAMMTLYNNVKEHLSEFTEEDDPLASRSLLKILERELGIG